MSTEDVSPRYRELDTWGDLEVLEALLERQFVALAAVRAAVPALAEAARRAASRLAEGGALAYAGAGTAGRLAVLDGAELPPTFGWPEDRLRLFLAGGEAAMTRAVEAAEDDAAAGRRAGEGLGPKDVLVAVSASGRTPYTLALAAAAREKGALTVGMANNPNTPLLASVEVPVLLDTGPEVIAGSTRLAAGTAQKAALNLFSTLVMVRLGRVYGNRMVAVRPANLKLRRRARALVAEIAGVDESQAEEALRAAGWEVPLAVLLARGLEPETARRRLAEAGGNLREALL